MMNVAEYIVEELISYGVTDTFGVPGGVILRILYAMQSRTPKLTPHLNKCQDLLLVAMPRQVGNWVLHMQHVVQGLQI